MRFADFCLLCVVCLVWGLNVVVTRWVVADAGVPPLFFAALRLLGIMVLLAWWLRPVPGDLLRLFGISMCLGAAHFGLLFVGLAHAEASAVAIVVQLGVPFSTLMSMTFLGETIGWRRGLGITLAIAGSLIIAFDPSEFSLSYGLILVAISALTGAYGGILMKQMAPISAFQLQAWLGAFSLLPTLALSAVLESGQWTAYASGGIWVWLATAFAVIGVSIFGHGAFYSLVKRYDVSLLSPLTLMTPIWGVVFGITLLGEHLTMNLMFGSVVSLGGVLVIVLRQNKAMPEAALGNKTGGPT
ncbi:MAG: DMT family transporter [Pseudomonadota bacterium]